MPSLLPRRGANRFSNSLPFSPKINQLLSRLSTPFIYSFSSKNGPEYCTQSSPGVHDLDSSFSWMNCLTKSKICFFVSIFYYWFKILYTCLIPSLKGVNLKSGISDIIFSELTSFLN